MRPILSDRNTVQSRLILVNSWYNQCMQLVEITDKAKWDEFVVKSPWGHPLQLWGWGETKRTSDWLPHRLAVMDGERIVAGVQVLLWRLPKLSYWIVYAPRGPVVEPGSEGAEKLLEALTAWARANDGLYVRLEPAWTTGAPAGWVHSRQTLQMAATFTLDLHKSESELLEPMSRKHRQYIRKAERDGVSVVRVDATTAGELAPMYELYLDTAKRAKFGVHGEGYYRKLGEELGQSNYLYYAYFEGKPVAFLWLAAAGATAYELYGGVNAVGVEMKANYVLKWEAIRAMKAAGYVHYDFNGRVSDGVSRFKEGFGPDETNYIGTYDYPLNKLGYRLWEGLWPMVKVAGRRMAVLRRGR